MFEKEAEIEFQKLPLTEREKLVSVVQVWNKAFVSGANFGFQKCAKLRLNITTISDRPVEGIIEELQVQIEKMKCCYNCSKWKDGQCTDVPNDNSYYSADFVCEDWEIKEK